MKKQEAAGIVDRLETEYRQSVDSLRTALKAFLAGGPPPDAEVRRNGTYVYPELRLTWPPGLPYPRTSRAYARIPSPGRYAITVTRPDLYRDHLLRPPPVRDLPAPRRLPRNLRAPDPRASGLDRRR